MRLDKWNLPQVNSKTQQTSLPQVFCGGDLAGCADTTVESVNDGKIAAWHMHCFLQVILNIYENTSYIILDSSFFFSRTYLLIHLQSCPSSIPTSILLTFQLMSVD